MVTMEFLPLRVNTKCVIGSSPSDGDIGRSTPIDVLTGVPLLRGTGDRDRVEPSLEWVVKALFGLSEKIEFRLLPLG